MPDAQFAGVSGEIHHQIMIDGTESFLAAGFLERAAQAAEGGIEAAAQLRQ